MNTFLLLAATVFLPLSISHHATIQLDAVVAALSIGDAKAVGTYFDNTVELVLPSVDDILPKAQAEKKLALFFKENPANSFTRVHGGTSTGEDGAYVIGTLSTTNGSFRVYIYGRGAETPSVQELRIEPN